MTQPLVSVVIPTFNAEPWIKQTLESVFAQTYPRLEVIVVDDASTDGTVEILEQYNSKLQLLRNEKNKGVSACRNLAISHAQGDYIALLDHDDLWYPDKTVKQMALFDQNPDLGLVFGEVLYQTSKGTSYRAFEVMPPARGRALPQLLETDFIPVSTAILPKKVLDAVGLFREDLCIVEDHELFLRIAMRFQVDYVDEPLAVYRMHEKNLSRRAVRCQQERIALESHYIKEGGFEGTIALDYLRLGLAYMEERQILKAAGPVLKGTLCGLKHPLKTVQALVDNLRQRKRLNPWKA